MLAQLVDVSAQDLDKDTCFGARPEPFERQAFIAELAIEALRCAVPPGLAGIDQSCLDALVDGLFEKVQQAQVLRPRRCGDRCGQQGRRQRAVAGLASGG